MKKYVLILVSVIGIFFASCSNQNTAICEHCKEETETANHLIGHVDMEICNDCYESYLHGDWGSEYEK